MVLRAPSTRACPRAVSSTKASINLYATSPPPHQLPLVLRDPPVDLGRVRLGRTPGRPGLLRQVILVGLHAQELPPFRLGLRRAQVIAQGPAALHPLLVTGRGLADDAGFQGAVFVRGMAVEILHLVGGELLDFPGP